MADEVTDLSILADVVGDEPAAPIEAEPPAPAKKERTTKQTADGDKILTRAERDALEIQLREAKFASRVEPGDLERMPSDEFLAHIPDDKRMGARGQLVRTHSQGVAGNRADMWFENGVQINKPGLTIVNSRVRAEISGKYPATFVRCTLSPGLIDLPGHTFIDCTTKEL